MSKPTGMTVPAPDIDAAPAGEAEPYERLAAMIELELELAAAGEIEALASAAAQRRTFAASLPAVPPAAAADALRRAQLLHERAVIEALRVKEALIASLRQGERAIHATRGYAPARRRRYSTSA